MNIPIWASILLSLAHVFVFMLLIGGTMKIANYALNKGISDVGYFLLGAFCITCVLGFGLLIPVYWGASYGF